MERRPWVPKESRAPRQKNVAPEDRREDTDSAADKRFDAEGSSGIALKSSELKEYRFEDETERRFDDFVILDDPPREKSDIDVGVVDAVD
jgi:hypothetical protein